MTLYFLPGMRPATVSGAAGASGRHRAKKLVSGFAYHGAATPTNLVPYEELRTDNGRKARAAKYDRGRDVAEAYDMAKYQTNAVRERLREARAEAEQVVAE